MQEAVMKKYYDDTFIVGRQEKMACISPYITSELPYETIKNILDFVSDSIVLYDKDSGVEWINRGASTLFALDSRYVVGLSCHDLFLFSPKHCLDCPVSKSFSRGTVETGHIESPMGSFFELRTLPLLDENGMVVKVLEFINDVSEKDRQNTMDTCADQLPSLEELAAGVAHEINNPINGIINYAQILVNRLSCLGQEREISSKIIAEGERIAGIVQSLVTFSRENAQPRPLLSISDILSDCLSLIQAQFKEDGIHLAIHIEPDLPRLEVNVRQMRQVFLNLLSNARHALNERYPQLNQDKILVISGKRIGNNYLCLEFLDYGTGISPDVLDKVMTPFFSTKGSQKGIGLGLSTCRNIMAQHNGTLHIESVHGYYTKVQLEIPFPDDSRLQEIQVTT